MKKIYNTNGIGMAALLGGPLAAGYFLSKNYEVFEKKENSKNAIIISVIATVIVFGSIALIPDNINDKIPNYLFPIIFALIARFIVDKYQKAEINAYISEGGEFYSNWRTAGISMIIAVVTLVSFLLLYLLAV